MDFWRRTVGRCRIGQVIKIDIREGMKVNRNIIDDIKGKQLIWFEHVKRMSKARLTKVSTEVEASRKKEVKPPSQERGHADDNLQFHYINSQKIDDTAKPS
ncbi:hypothetical protein Trydic_g12343 [Trypoxylus dichotomus]